MGETQCFPLSFVLLRNFVYLLLNIAARVKALEVDLRVLGTRAKHSAAHWIITDLIMEAALNWYMRQLV